MQQQVFGAHAQAAIFKIGIVRASDKFKSDCAMTPAIDRSSLDTARVLKTIARMLRGLEISDRAIEVELHDISRRLDTIAGGQTEQEVQVN